MEFTVTVCPHGRVAGDCRLCELAALKRDREWLRNMEREVARLQKDNARMKPVFDAAVGYMGKQHAFNNHDDPNDIDGFMQIWADKDSSYCDLSEAVRKLDP